METSRVIGIIHSRDVPPCLEPPRSPIGIASYLPETRHRRNFFKNADPMRILNYRGLATTAFAGLNRLCGHAASRQVDARLDGNTWVIAADGGG